MKRIPVVSIEFTSRDYSLNDLRSVIYNMGNGMFHVQDNDDAILMIGDSTNPLPIQTIREVCAGLRHFYRNFRGKGSVMILGDKGFQDVGVSEDIRMVLIEIGIDKLGRVYFIHEDAPDIEYVILQEH